MEVLLIGAQRLIGLADGVFSIAMTLLVFGLVVPAVSAEQSLSQALLGMWPEFLLYGLSFLVLGVYWIMHHAIFDSVLFYDSTLAWINIFLLMIVALIPFTTSLFGVHGPTLPTALAYGTNLLLGFALLWALFRYAARNAHLMKDDMDPLLLRGGHVMGMIYIAVLAAGLGLAFVRPVASFMLYGIFVLAIVVFTLIGRGEHVMVWRRQREARRSRAP